MKHTLSNIALQRLSEFVARHLGLSFPKKKWSDLETKVQAAAKDSGCNDTGQWLDLLLSSPLSRNQAEMLARHLTVGETYFYRDGRLFETLEKHILPELLLSARKTGRGLRIWSAGCSTGEEPYSLAILLDRMGALRKEQLNATILASDINPHSLLKARGGVFTKWSFRDTPRWFSENYFTTTEDGRFSLVSRIAEKVIFSSINLVEGSYPSIINTTNAMDIILCRNVLMYFTPEQADQVIKRFRNCLVSGGWLIVNPCETFSRQLSRFSCVNSHGVILYQKVSPEIGVEIPANDCRDAKPVSKSQKIEISNHSPLHERPASPSPQTYFLAQASSLFEEGHYAKATEALDGILSKGRNEVESLALMCRNRANEGNLVEALRLSEEAIVVEKLNAGLHFLRAMILQELGELDGAVTSLKRALYIDQEMVIAHYNLGHLTLRQQKRKESRKHFGHALTLLDKYRPDEILPESEGISAWRLKEIITSTCLAVQREGQNNGK